MKKFGEKFEKYEPIEVENVSIPDVDRDKEVSGDEAFKLIRIKGGPASELEKELEKEMNRPIIEIAPTANAYQILPDQENLTDYMKKTFSWFNYYLVEFGLNAMVGREFKVPELRLNIVLKCDKKETDVVAYDIAPKNEISYTKLLSGNVKINLGVTSFLKLVPMPLGEIIPDLLSIDINPWEFEWGIKKCSIDACGESDCNVSWRLYDTDVVQKFNPVIIIKAKKEVSSISAGARCIYKLKAGSSAIAPKIESKEKEIPVWPL